MNALGSLIPCFLKSAAAMQLGIAVLNLFLVGLLKWKEELRRVPLLMGEVFQVHVWFISMTLALFAAMTWRFAPEIASRANPVCRVLVAGIGIFWALRTLVQIAYYSSNHWRGKPGRTIIHCVLLLIYGGFAGLYLWSAMPAAASQ